MENLLVNFNLMSATRFNNVLHSSELCHSAGDYLSNKTARRDLAENHKSKLWLNLVDIVLAFNLM